MTTQTAETPARQAGGRIARKRGRPRKNPPASPEQSRALAAEIEKKLEADEVLPPPPAMTDEEKRLATESHPPSVPPPPFRDKPEQVVRQDGREPIDYAVCHMCGRGGPADVGKEKSWPIYSERDQQLARAGKLACPSCGKHDSGLYRPSPEALAQIEQRGLKRQLETERKEREALEREVQRLRNKVEGHARPDPSRDILRGQNRGR